MIEIAEMFRPERPALWRLAKQAGVDHAVSVLAPDDGGPERPWDYAPMARVKAAYEQAGLELAVLECSPPMEKIRLGLAGRDEELDWFCTMLTNMGALGIPVLCYNFMAHFGWTRTHVDIPWRGGALVTGYDHASMADLPLTEHGEVPEERIWDNYRYFLHRVLPVAERAGVKLALHPDDPPRSPIRGIGRIMRTVENFQRALDIAESECHGITMCQGNFTLMTDDLPATIRHFGCQGRIHFVHFRDVRGTADKFQETFHEEGKTDMYACMRVYADLDWRGVLRPDHVPTLDGDSNDDPCYSSIGRLLAIGYITGLREAAYGRKHDRHLLGTP